MGCKKAQEFLEARSLTVSERADASKDRRGRAAVLELARAVEHVVVARGKKVVTFNMKKDPPDDDTLAASLLGPSGNLKAPTIRRGKTLLVGFGAAAYEHVLGA